MNAKKHHCFGHFFIQMWACEVQLSNFLLVQKYIFCEFEGSYLVIHMVEISEIFPTYSQVSILVFVFWALWGQTLVSWHNYSGLNLEGPSSICCMVYCLNEKKTPLQHTTRSYSYKCPKMSFFFQNLVLVLEMAVLERFWWKHSQSPLGVKF